MASLQPLKFLVVPPKVKHTATVILLHGLGDSGAGWEPVARMMQQQYPELDHIKWVLPHAPQRRITLNLRTKMPAWYDIVSLLNINSEEDEAGMLASARSINEIITSEIYASPDITASRIVLGGFSQGGATSLFTGLTTERKLAGLFALSSYLPLREKLKSMLSEHVKKLPIFMGHGTADQVVKFEFGKGSAAYLMKEYGCSAVESGKVAGPGVRFEEYENMVHSGNPMEFYDLSQWLKVVVPQ